MSEISLTAGMRSNLLSLQNTNNLMNQVQQRLSTGKRVNSALENPTNYFAAESHKQRASDLSVRKDGMAEAIQLVKAADAGIKAITSLIESAKGIASAALATSSTTERSTYSNTFNTLMTQISQLASDSGYRGTNLLTGSNQTVEFGQATGDSTLDINGFNATSDGLGVDDVSDWSTETLIKSSSSQLEAALSTLREESSKLSSNLSVVTNRQSFTDTMINTLQTGADNLTLSDANEDGAQMLMLQTRQNLGITSLSLASQAAQSILRLF